MLHLTNGDPHLSSPLLFFLFLFPLLSSSLSHLSPISRSLSMLCLHSVSLNFSICFLFSSHWHPSFLLWVHACRVSLVPLVSYLAPQSFLRCGFLSPLFFLSTLSFTTGTNLPYATHHHHIPSLSSPSPLVLLLLSVVVLLLSTAVLPLSLLWFYLSTFTTGCLSSHQGSSIMAVGTLD